MAPRSRPRAGQAEGALPCTASCLPKREQCTPSCRHWGVSQASFPTSIHSCCLQALQWKSGRWGFFCFAVQLRFFSCREQQVCMGTADAGHPVCTRTVLAAERSFLPPSTWPKLHIPLCQPCPTSLSWEMGTGDRHCTMQCRQGGHGQVQGSVSASVPWPVVSRERPYPVPCWHLSSLADLPPHIRDVANTRCSEETPQTHACTTAGVRPDCPQNKEISLQEHLGQAKGWERAGTQSSAGVL